MIRQPPISTPFPTRRSSDLVDVHCLTGWNGHCTHASTGSPFFWAGFQRRFLAMSKASLLKVSRFEGPRSEEHTSELQSRQYLVCRLLLEKKNKKHTKQL